MINNRAPYNPGSVVAQWNLSQAEALKASMQETWHWVQKATAYEEIVQAIADGDVYHDSKGGMLIVADADTLLAKARALLADRA